MKLLIQHQTIYEYTWPVLYSIQHVRLTPQQVGHQKVLAWHVRTPGKASQSVDHFGNTVMTFSVNGQHSEICVASQGTIEIETLTDGYLPQEKSAANPLVFQAFTPLTQANAEMRDFSSFVADHKMSFKHRVLALANVVADRVAYTTGSTTVADSAQQAFDNGQGVCQDHSHVMLACLRAHGIAARYVSGYYYNPNAATHDSHAWVEAFDPNLQQWVGIDATHRAWVDEKHCKIAVAKDFTGASPVRGIRTGGGKERMQSQVSIARID